MTVGNVLQAAFFALTIVLSVATFAVALFGATAALERWLDGPTRSHEPAQPQLVIVPTSRAPMFDPDAHPNVA